MINHIFVPDNTISKVECVELGVLYTTAVLQSLIMLMHAKTCVVCIVISTGSYQYLIQKYDNLALLLSEQV